MLNSNLYIIHEGVLIPQQAGSYEGNPEYEKLKSHSDSIINPETKWKPGKPRTQVRNSFIYLDTDSYTI